MTTQDRQPRRALAWPDVTALALIVVLVLGVGTLVLICTGRFW